MGGGRAAAGVRMPRQYHSKSSLTAWHDGSAAVMLRAKAPASLAIGRDVPGQRSAAQGHGVVM